MCHACARSSHACIPRTCLHSCVQYCGSSLSRVGLDFQGLLQPLFESCSLQLFASHLAAAVDSFNSRLEAHKWVPLPAAVIAAGRGAGAAGRQAEARKSAASGGLPPPVHKTSPEGMCCRLLSKIAHCDDTCTACTSRHLRRYCLSGVISTEFARRRVKVVQNGPEMINRRTFSVSVRESLKHPAKSASKVQLTRPND